jgi:hypothetical protein
MIPEAEKDTLLLRVAQGDGQRMQAELLARLRQAVPAVDQQSSGRRTVDELLALAAARRDERQRRAWQRRERHAPAVIAVGNEAAVAPAACRPQGWWFLLSQLAIHQREFAATCFSSYTDPVSPGTVGDVLIGFDVRCKPVGYIQLVLEDDKDRINVTPDNLEPGTC